MKLTSLQKKIFKFIAKEYPVPWDQSDTTIIALGERPIPTIEIIGRQFPKSSKQDIDEALRRLIGLQYIAEIPLLHKGNYQDILMAPGCKERAPVQGGPTPAEGYQITIHGKEMLATFPFNISWKTLVQVAFNAIKQNPGKVITAITVIAGPIWYRFGCSPGRPQGADNPPPQQTKIAPPSAIDRPTNKSPDRPPIR